MALIMKLSSIPVSAYILLNNNNGNNNSGNNNNSRTAATTAQQQEQQQQQQQEQQHQQQTTESSATTPPTSIASTSICAGSTSNITRSVSAPVGSRPEISSTSSNTTTVGQRSRLYRNQSRTEAIKNYIKRETATFFGVNEESEAVEKQKWLDRRRRMALRKYGTLLPQYRPPDPDITKDVPDSMEIPDSVTLRKWQRPVRRKDSVARMTLSGLQYMVDTLRRQRPLETSATQGDSRSFPPSVIQVVETPTADAAVDDDEEEETFFQAPLAMVVSAAPTTDQENETQLMEDLGATAIVTEDADGAGDTSVIDASEGIGRIWSPSTIVVMDKRTADRASVDCQTRRSRAISTRDHYTLRIPVEFDY
ncbi:PREDICTED: uncharacterized protein LOC105366102 [Ceratosolen solmsi marchali]|uniref:Uncharacterized protein LOC105366102 n=1 Tax=Ceratosolen solmsi marchali TaxID=326594 RepID=A0AAJ6YR73_9HYME|nr:PREDICTED: uncharacterized protein LOC105366102 [Ceratosolen solmsi marchali]